MSIKYHDVNVGVTLGSGGSSVDTIYYKVGTTPTANPVKADEEINISAYSTGYLVPCDSSGSNIKLDLSQPFEICCKFKIANNPGTTTRNTWGSSNNYYQCPTIGVRASEIICYITTGGSSWTYSITITPSGYSFPLDTWCIAKLTWDGSDFACSFNDGTNTYTTSLVGVSPYYNSGYSFEVGGQNKSQYSISACNATIDLSNTYLKQNGTIIWGSAA